MLSRVASEAETVAEIAATVILLIRTHASCAAIFLVQTATVIPVNVASDCVIRTAVDAAIVAMAAVVAAVAVEIAAVTVSVTESLAAFCPS